MSVAGEAGSAMLFAKMLRMAPRAKANIPLRRHCVTVPPWVVSLFLPVGPHALTSACPRTLRSQPGGSAACMAYRRVRYDYDINGDFDAREAAA